ncbi:MAG: HlyD family efflux transporter periplasmic adaptor subunit, partial [Chloroflexi bacterium]|nr:HlyD family efflux transporter periplasmic adaptor subunit [Chloroflexota bacterium]
MKKFATALSLTLSLLLLLTACGSKATDTSAATPTPAEEPVIAEGHLFPNQSVYLAFLASGRVDEVLVQKGDHVSQGQVLVRLGDREQVEAALAGAQAQGVAAQQAYDLLIRNADLGHAQAWQTYMDTQKARAAAQLAWDRLDQHTIQTELDNAQTDVTSRQTDLDNAQTDLDKYSTLPADNATRKSYEDLLQFAQTNYDTAVQKAEDLTNRRDTVHAALKAALAAEAEAKRTYENTQDGPEPGKLALAQAQLDAAKAQAAAAQSALDNYDLKAPFAGTVADINGSVYQMVSPQTWVVALADTSQWHVDTSDLTEMDVVKISVGQSVQVTADARPGVPMTGVVESI